MADYTLYANSCGIKQNDMVRVIQQNYPRFGKPQMSLASNPQRNALQLIPAAEDLLVEAFGKGPGLSISPRLSSRRSHGNKNKPNRLYLRLSDALRSQVERVYQAMCFASMQDFLEAAVAEFVERHSPRS